MRYHLVITMWTCLVLLGPSSKDKLLEVAAQLYLANIQFKLITTMQAQMREWSLGKVCIRNFYIN